MSDLKRERAKVILAAERGGRTEMRMRAGRSVVNLAM